MISYFLIHRQLWKFTATRWNVLFILWPVARVVPTVGLSEKAYHGLVGSFGSLAIATKPAIAPPNLNCVFNNSDHIRSSLIWHCSLLSKVDSTLLLSLDCELKNSTRCPARRCEISRADSSAFSQPPAEGRWVLICKSSDIFSFSSGPKVKLDPAVIR